MIVKLSRRLQAVAALCQPWQRLADIGSDHAHLPIYLYENGQIQTAVAGEVIRGPYTIAQQNVRAAGLQTHIQVRLADGLTAIRSTDHCQCAVIAGMGGMLITQILDRRPDVWQKLTGLVLQPNQDVKLVRRWLMQHQWQITAEDIVFDDGHFYQMLAAKPAKQSVPYSAKALLFGPLLLEAHSDTFLAYWQFRLQQKELILAQLRRAQQPPCVKMKTVTQEIALIKEVLGHDSYGADYH